MIFLVIQIFNAEEYMLYGIYETLEDAQGKLQSLKTQYAHRDDLEIKRITFGDLEI